jgi:hypothetical protein
MTVASTAILAALLREPVYHRDRAMTEPERVALFTPVAEAIAEVSRTATDAASLVALLEHETHGARDVLTGHCDQMPKGERCDNLRARGGWQLHRAACPKAWALVDGSAESIRIEAACALRQLHYQAHRGREHARTPLHAAFAGYAARPWNWEGADARVRTTKRIAVGLGGAS